MRRMFILKAIAVVLLVCLFALCGYVFLVREYEVSKLDDVHEVRFFKNAFTEQIRVIDVNTGRTLFQYPDGSGIIVENVHKRSNGEWQIVIREK